MSAALEGLKVVDLTNVGPGAHCVKILADLGAEVVRIVEAASVMAKRGRTQWKAPFWAYGMRRNTKVLGLDLKSTPGLEVFCRLAERADVVMVGRHILRGAYGGGADGVALFVNKLRTELQSAMVLTGVPSVSKIDSSILYT